MRRAAVAAERLGRFGVVVSTVQRENDTRPVQYRPVQYIRRRRQYSTEGKRPGRYSTIGVVIGTVQKEHDTRPRQADPRLFHVGPWSCPGPLPSAAPTCTTDEGVRRAGWRSNSPWLPRPLPLHSLQSHTSCLFTPSLVLSLLVSF